MGFECKMFNNRKKEKELRKINPLLHLLKLLHGFLTCPPIVASPKIKTFHDTTSHIGITIECVPKNLQASTLAYL
jgi:hypothetical protein